MKKALGILFVIVLFQSVILSCSNSDDNGESPINGSWRISSIKISSAILNQQASANENILIDFQSNGDFDGSTSVNQFGGRFETESTTLTMLEFTTTEVVDTQFGTAFYAAITAAQVPNTTFAQFGFSFDSGDLILSFGNGGEMLLER